MSILEEAKKIISGNRQDDYGTPENSFNRIADYWNNFLKHKDIKHNLTDEDVCMMMVLLKIAREEHKHKQDNLIDACGYLALLDGIIESKIATYPSSKEEEKETPTEWAGIPILSTEPYLNLTSHSLLSRTVQVKVCFEDDYNVADRKFRFESADAGSKCSMVAELQGEAFSPNTYYEVYGITVHYDGENILDDDFFAKQAMCIFVKRHFMRDGTPWVDIATSVKVKSRYFDEVTNRPRYPQFKCTMLAYCLHNKDTAYLDTINVIKGSVISNEWKVPDKWSTLAVCRNGDLTTYVKLHA